MTLSSAKFERGDIRRHWLTKSGNLFEHTATAPSPSKDFAQIIVSKHTVTFRLWKIVPPKNSSKDNVLVHPHEVIDTYEDFTFDPRLQSEIYRCFGEHLLNYVIKLVKGEIDYLPRLPPKILRKVINHLDLEDISKLLLVSKQFHDMVSDNQTWMHLFKKQSSTELSDMLKTLGKQIGWKKVFFMDKMKLQLMMSRIERGEPPEIEPDAIKDEDPTKIFPTQPPGSSLMPSDQTRSMPALMEQEKQPDERPRSADVVSVLETTLSGEV